MDNRWIFLAARAVLRHKDIVAAIDIAIG